MTVGPVLYSCWLVAAVVAWRAPRYQARVAWFCLGATLTVRELGAWLPRPPSAELLLLCCLGAPAALAPRTEPSRRTNIPVIVGLIALALLGVQAIWSGLPGRFDYWMAPLYWTWPNAIPRDMAYLAGAGAAVMVAMLLARRFLSAAVICLVVSLCSIVGGVSRSALYPPTRMNGFTLTSLIVGAVLGASLLTVWVADLRRAYLLSSGPPDTG